MTSGSERFEKADDPATHTYLVLQIEDGWLTSIA